MIKTKLIVMLAAITIISAGAGSTFTAYADNITNETAVINVGDEEESTEEAQNCGETAPLLIGCNITGEMKAGNTVTVPVYLKGVRNKKDVDVCTIRLKYNKNVFEDVTVEAGELCSSEQCFASKVDEEKQNIILCYISSDAYGSPEPLERDGVLANIKLKVKDDYDGTQPSKITADEISYSNSQGHDYKGFMANSNLQLPASIKLSLEEDSEPGCINPSFTITNTTGRKISLSGMGIQYYYTSEGKSDDDIFECTYAGTIDGDIQDFTSYVRGSRCNQSVNATYDSTDSSMYLSLSNGTLEDGQSMVIKTKMKKKNSTVSYQHANDYSYKNPNGVCVYLNDTLIYGIDPSNRNVGRVTVYGEANTGCEWKTSIRDKEIAEVIEKPCVKDKYASKQPSEFIIKGLKQGETQVTFNYVDPVKDEIVKRERYIVTVDSNLRVRDFEKIVHQENGFINLLAEKGYAWKCEVSDKSIAQIDEELVDADNAREGDTWRNKYWIVKGLKKGKTEAKFTYFNEKDGTIKETKTYIIDVDLDLNVTVTEKKEEATPVENKDLLLQVEESDNTQSNQINPKISLKNISGKELDLTNVKLKYYYTSDGDQDETFDCYYAGTTSGDYQGLTEYTEGKIIRLDDKDKTANADKCLEITFNGGTLKAEQEMSINAAIHKSDWSSYDRSNDYSYNDADKICGFLNDELVSGSDIVVSDDKKEEEIQDSSNNLNIDIETEGVDRYTYNTVETKIYLSDLKKSIEGCTLQLLYDEDAFSVVDIKPGVIIPNKSKTFISKFSKGKIILFFANSFDEQLDTINEDGVFATIHFKVKDHRANYDDALKLVDDKDKCFFCATDGSELNLHTNFETDISFPC